MVLVGIEQAPGIILTALTTISVHRFITTYITIRHPAKLVNPVIVQTGHMEWQVMQESTIADDTIVYPYTQIRWLQFRELLFVQVYFQMTICPHMILIAKVHDCNLAPEECFAIVSKAFRQQRHQTTCLQIMLATSYILPSMIADHSLLPTGLTYLLRAFCIFLNHLIILMCSIKTQ
ncbi:hypothetical protein D3C72_848600 [compost metagenome]